MAATYRERPAAPELHPWVRCVWTGVTRTPDTPRGWVLPDGCSDIIWWRGGDPVVAGPDTDAKPVTLPLGICVVGVRFHPGAAPGMLGVPLSELRDTQTELAALWGDAGARPLHARLEESAHVDQGMAVLEEVLCERLGTASTPDGAVVAHADALERGGTRSAELPVQERQLRRRFVAAVGYGPKTFERIARLQRFLILAEQRPRRHPSLAPLACAAGYADQAHLSRDCRRLTHQPPAALLAGR